MDRRLFLSLTGATALAGCATGGGTAKLAPGTTLIILRHADRVNEDLTDLGRQRAAALVTALDGIPIDAIYAPGGIKRNLETAAPLAAARGLPVESVGGASSPVPALFTKGAGGRTVVWVGNKGNLADIWQALGAPGAPPVEYGDLFFVTPGRLGGGVRVDRRHHGP